MLQVVGDGETGGEMGAGGKNKEAASREHEIADGSNENVNCQCGEREEVGNDKFKRKQKGVAKHKVNGKIPQRRWIFLCLLFFLFFLLTEDTTGCKPDDWGKR